MIAAVGPLPAPVRKGAPILSLQTALESRLLSDKRIMSISPIPSSEGIIASTCFGRLWFIPFVSTAGKDRPRASYGTGGGSICGVREALPRIHVSDRWIYRSPHIEGSLLIARCRDRLIPPDIRLRVMHKLLNVGGTAALIDCAGWIDADEPAECVLALVAQKVLTADVSRDVAPKFYPALSSFWRVDFACSAG